MFKETVTDVFEKTLHMRKIVLTLPCFDVEYRLPRRDKIRRD